MASMSPILARAVPVLLAVLWAATAADAMGYMVVEETCERRVVPPPPVHQPLLQLGGAYPACPICSYPVSYNAQPVHHHQEAPCTCGGSKKDGTCTCGGSKKDGTCTCGKKDCKKKQDTCPCGGSKKDGTCTCGQKKSKCKDAAVHDFAHEGISTLFKVVRGGMKMVEHLADHINQKKQGCGCGCGGGGCGCGGGGCGCGCACCGCRR